MSLSLEDVLLILLHDRPTTAFELHGRYQQVFGNQAAVNFSRVLAAVNRLRRTGHVGDGRTIPSSARTANRTVLALTEAGRHRRRIRLITVHADATADDIVALGLLALDTAERADFDEFVDRALAVLRLRQGLRTTSHWPVEAARAAFEREVMQALVAWLTQLPTYRLDQPHGSA